VFSGHVSERGGDWIGPRQEFVETSVRMAVDDLRDRCREIGVGIDAVELARLDQRSDHGPMLGTAIRSDVMMPSVPQCAVGFA
jgi:hypothetical protein